MNYYQVKFGQFILEDTVIFVNKIVEAEHIHQAVELVCGDWKWGSGIKSYSNNKFTFSDKDGKWAQVKEVFPPECSCEDIMFLKNEQWYCPHCDREYVG